MIERTKFHNGDTIVTRSGRGRETGVTVWSVHCSSPKCLGHAKGMGKWRGGKRVGNFPKLNRKADGCV